MPPNRVAQKLDLAETTRDFSPANGQREGHRPEAGFEMTNLAAGRRRAAD